MKVQTLGSVLRRENEMTRRWKSDAHKRPNETGYFRLTHGGTTVGGCHLDLWQNWRLTRPRCYHDAGLTGGVELSIDPPSGTQGIASESVDKENLSLKLGKSDYVNSNISVLRVDLCLIQFKIFYLLWHISCHVVNPKRKWHKDCWSFNYILILSTLCLDYP